MIVKNGRPTPSKEEMKREQETADRAARWTRYTGIATWVAAIGTIGATILASVTAIILALQLSAARGQLNEARDQSVYDHPPKVRVTNVSIGGNDGPPMLSPKAIIPGRAWIVNDGSDIATIKTIVCVTYWKIGPLPMLRPYDVNDRNTQSCGMPRKPDGTYIKPQTAFAPGEIAAWQFNTVVPQEYKVDMFLYVMGSILFFDRLGVRHLTLFARKYDLDQGRFVEVKDNHDYEGVE
jgi:hypothetical protein